MLGVGGGTNRLVRVGCCQIRRAIWGEVAALRVSDIDFLRRRITLHSNAVAVGGEVIVGSLKTGHARTVPLPLFAAEALAKTRLPQLVGIRGPSDRRLRW